MIVRRATKNSTVVAGGGAIDVRFYHGTVYQMKGFIRYDLSWYSVSS